MSLLDNFWPKELRGYFCKSLKVSLGRRIHRIPRTRVQSAAVRAPNLWYSSNTCAKCCRLSSEFIVFLEHVCKVRGVRGTSWSTQAQDGVLHEVDGVLHEVVGEGPRHIIFDLETISQHEKAAGAKSEGLTIGSCCDYHGSKPVLLCDLEIVLLVPMRLRLQAPLLFRAFGRTFRRTFFAHLICPFNLLVNTRATHECAPPSVL